MLTKETEKQKVVLATGGATDLKWSETECRLTLRAKPDALTAISAATELDIPKTIGKRSTDGQMEVACIGPDEWMILCPLIEGARISAALADIYSNVPHSLTDISEREVTIAVSGSAAKELLTIGIARDLDSFVVGEVRRTIMQDIQIVLWRDGENAFRIDVWRSFADHLFRFLETGLREIGAEANLTNPIH
jgi:sarcosine oxidase subunit gamma